MADGDYPFLAKMPGMEAASRAWNEKMLDNVLKALDVKADDARGRGYVEMMIRRNMGDDVAGRLIRVYRARFEKGN